jgi:hypothetical protein
MKISFNFFTSQLSSPERKTLHRENNSHNRMSVTSFFKVLWSHKFSLHYYTSDSFKYKYKTFVYIDNKPNFPSVLSWLGELSQSLSLLISVSERPSCIFLFSNMWIFIHIFFAFDLSHNLVLIREHIMCNLSSLTITKIYWMVWYLVSFYKFQSCNFPLHDISWDNLKVMASLPKCDFLCFFKAQRGRLALLKHFKLGMVCPPK